jgi:hypothetical protein
MKLCLILCLFFTALGDMVISELETIFYLDLAVWFCINSFLVGSLFLPIYGLYYWYFCYIWGHTILHMAFYYDLGLWSFAKYLARIILFFVGCCHWLMVAR